MREQPRLTVEQDAEAQGGRQSAEETELLEPVTLSNYVRTTLQPAGLRAAIKICSTCLTLEKAREVAQKSKSPPMQPGLQGLAGLRRQEKTVKRSKKIQEN